jgi:hypothetical protein
MKIFLISKHTGHSISFFMCSKSSSREVAAAVGTLIFSAHIARYVTKMIADQLAYRGYQLRCLSLISDTQINRVFYKFENDIAIKITLR